MADKDMLDFLAGLKVYDADIEVRDDVVVAVATVGGPFAEYHGAEEHASWIVEACRRASRTCATCRFWQAWEPGLDEGTCSGIISGTALVRRAADFCSLWQGGERDDTACND